MADPAEVSPEAHDQGNVAAPDHLNHREPESLLVALDPPEPRAVSSDQSPSSTEDTDPLPYHSAPDLTEAIAQQPDRSDRLPQPHPEVDDLDGVSLARDQSSEDQSSGANSLSTLASQPVNLADRLQMPANSVARNG